MPRQYLDVPYRSKNAARALGARFDGAVKRWGAMAAARALRQLGQQS